LYDPKNTRFFWLQKKKQQEGWGPGTCLQDNRDAMKENKDPNTTPRKARESKEQREADRRHENEESDVFEIGSTAPWLREAS